VAPGLIAGIALVLHYPLVSDLSSCDDVVQVQCRYQISYPLTGVSTKSSFCLNEKRLGKLGAEQGNDLVLRSLAVEHALKPHTSPIMQAHQNCVRFPYTVQICS
jgi:hypothetical protein